MTINNSFNIVTTVSKVGQFSHLSQKFLAVPVDYLLPPHPVAEASK